MNATATQLKVLGILGLSCDGTYDHAGRTLQAAGVAANGCPKGLTPGKTKKLSDEELIEALGIKLADVAGVAVKTSREVAEEEAERQAKLAEYFRLQRIQDKKEYAEREENNKILRAHGYRWVRNHEDNWPDEAGYMPEWSLFAPNGEEVTVQEALQQIRG